MKQIKFLYFKEDKIEKLLNKVVLFLILSLTAFSYNFPIEDPYSATIIGSATMMTPGVSENIPLKVYEIQIKRQKKKFLMYFGMQANLNFLLVNKRIKKPL